MQHAAITGTHGTMSSYFRYLKYLLQFLSTSTWPLDPVAVESNTFVQQEQHALLFSVYNSLAGFGYLCYDHHPAPGQQHGLQDW
jgi:hypothetical protein